MKRTRVALIALFAGLVVASAGCSKSLKTALVPNVPPSVRLTSAPYDTTSRYFYAYKLDWIGNDPDGRVEYFLYAIDPDLSGDTPIQWTKTTKNEQIIFFKATSPDPQDSTNKAIAFHTFAIRAVDDGGDSSDVVTRAFFSYTVAPQVGITDPRPSHLTVAYVTPSVRITWQGSDPDGQLTQKPVKYKFTLISNSSKFPLSTALGPNGLDLLREFYAPAFAGWDSVGGDTTSVSYQNLTPDASYLFVVVAFDEAGAYSPIFTLDSNCLRMTVKLAGAGGPKITLFNEFFTYTYASGSYNPTDQANWIHVEVPYNQPITFNWFAESDQGAQIAYYRWRLGGDVADETPRTNEATDVGHWSSPSINNISATIGPFLRDTVMFFYVEAADNNGLKSLGIVNFVVVKPSFIHDLGVINDTRFLLDVFRVGTTQYLPPSGNWPTAAEFDTFMFAKGGYPYQGGYPAGTISRPGVFQGYDYDTFSTRVGRGDMTVPLSELGKYKHIIWITDIVSSGKSGNGLAVANAASALSYMCDRNKVNTLATYVKEGGEVWLLGAGIAHASQVHFDRSNSGIYSADGRELIPGRFLWDIIHWRNDVYDKSGTLFKFHKVDRAFTNPHPIGRVPTTYPPDQWNGNFHGDYTAMPDTLRLKSLALGDSLPPYRAGGFYLNTFAFSEIEQENKIIENLNPDPAGAEDFESTLDSLYNVVYAQPDPNTPPLELPIATYYHGLENTPVVYTSLDAWLFSKVDFVQLTDFVLQKVWNLSFDSSKRGYAARRAPVASSVRPMPARSMPSFQGGARTLIGGTKSAGRRVLTAPGRKPQE